MDNRLSVVVMAAGKGTRMKNPDIAKVMHTVLDKPMVQHVVDLAAQLEASRTIVIVGWQKDSVIAHLQGTSPSVVCVEQSPQLGTGHAVMQAEEPLRGFTGEVLVLSGDVPVLTYGTLAGLLKQHRETGSTATVLTAVLEDATGYGRIVRNPEGQVVGIVEHKDATDDQRAIREINSGIYVFDAVHLFEALKHITPANAQKEYYLTDVFKYFWLHGLPVGARATSDPHEIQGVNDLRQLEAARQVMAGRERI